MTEANVSEEKKPETIHVKRFMNGRWSAAQVHRKLAWNGARCQGCGSAAPEIRILSFAEFAELNAREEGKALLVKLALQHEGKVPVIAFKFGSSDPKKFVKIGETFACSLCRKTAESAAGRGPSWVLVEIQEVPKDAVAVQVPH